LTGIGIQVAPEAKRLLIITPLAGSPAQAAGLKPGDAVLAVDGKLVCRSGPHRATDAIRGKAGTVVAAARRAGEWRGATINRDARHPSHPFDQRTRGAMTLRLELLARPGAEIGYIQIAELRRKRPRIAVRSSKVSWSRSQRAGCRCAALPGRAVGRRGRDCGFISSRGHDRLDQGERDSGDDSSRHGQEFPGDFPVMVLVDGYTASAAEISPELSRKMAGRRSWNAHVRQGIGAIDSAGRWQRAIRLTTAYFYLAGARRIDRQPGVENWGVDPFRWILSAALHRPG